MDEPDSFSQLLLPLLEIKGFDINLFNSSSLISFAVVAVLLVCSALISASEVAFFSLEQKDLEDFKADEDSKVAKTVLELLNNHQKLLATILITNNLINIGIVIVSTIWLSQSFIFETDFIQIFGLTIQSTSIEFVVQVVLITFILLLFGEIIPKVFANKNPFTIINLMAIPIKVLSIITSGLIKVLIGTSNLIDKRIKPKGYNVTVDELSKALELTSEEGDSTENEQRILEGIIRFGNTNAKQAMTSRVDVTAIESGTPIEEVIETISDTGHSRIPIYKETFDRITGILYIKDLLPHLDKPNFDWETILRKPMFIPESKKIDDLLKEFQTRKMHLAIVVDEYGGSSGVISMEDILEEIVGDIHDEFDDDNLLYSKLDEQQYLFDGKTPLHSLYKILDIEGDEFEEHKGEADTLAGFVIEIAEKIPLKNERINFADYTFTVEAADKRRIKRIKMSINEKEVSHE